MMIGQAAGVPEETQSSLQVMEFSSVAVTDLEN